MKYQTIADGFVYKPVYTFIQRGHWQDEPSTETCHYVEKDYEIRSKDDSYFSDLDWIVKEMRDGYQKEFLFNQTVYDSMRF